MSDPLPAAEESLLGMVGDVRCSVARTSKPWDLEIDAIVVSVGGSLGGLGEALRDQFPRAAWSWIRFDSISPKRPALMELPPKANQRLQLAVLATPHDSNTFRPTPSSIATATAAAIDAAATAGVAALGMPLLATGALGAPAKVAAAAAVPAAVAALEKSGQTSLRELVFLCQDDESAELIRSVFAKPHPGPIDEAAPIPTVDRRPAPTPAPSYSSVELAGGVSSDIVDPNRGIPMAKDQLGVAPYVSMLATVMADRKTPLPLSAGVFGEWGSGKSYFMGLLRDQITTLAGSDNTQYCDEIVQIGFNAWHYADTNLWASLGDEIFRQLAGPDPSSQQRAERIRLELAERLDQRRQLESATQQARATAATLQAKIDAATANRESTARDLVAALKNSPRFRERVDRLWVRLGITDEIEQGKLLAEQMRGTLTEADALRRIPTDRRGKIALATAAVLLLAGVFAAALAPAAREWLAGLAGVFAVGAGTGIAALTRARSGLRTLRELTEDLHAGMGRAAEDAISKDMSDTLDALREAEANQRVAEAQLDEVVSQVGELGRQLAQLAPGKRLYSFLADRARSDSYSGNLGLISTIRKDFEQLVELMTEWRTTRRPEEEDPARKPVDRIVLYIDDLDRCSPRQVVDVLQAVHLLLAFELFVVVVGVDPRWLLRSLRSHYTEILELDAATDTAMPSWRVTPEDYLEKIINVPLVLPGMSSGSLHRLLRSMVQDDIPETSSSEGVADQPAIREPRHVVEDVDLAAITIEQGSEVDTQRRGHSPAEIPRPLTDPEIDLLARLDLLIDTPREAKRLVNLYRMVRATRDLSEASRFLGDDGEPGEYQAVVVLLGLLTAHGRLLGSVLDTPPDQHNGIAGGLTHRPPNTSWHRFVSDFEPQQSGASWANRIVGAMDDGQVGQWLRLHRGLAHLSDTTSLRDLSALQTWVPRIRRFSYVLPPTAGRSIPVR